MLLGGSVPADAYVLFLPLQGDQAWLSLVAFLGAISAASSMVIISSIALSTMLSNEVVFPVLFKAVKEKSTNYDNFRFQLLNVRKALVFIVIILGYGVFYFASPDTLSSMGEIAFGAIAQLTPALIAAFYWRRASLKGVYTGIFAGFSVWLFFNFLPQLNLLSSPFSKYPYTWSYTYHWDLEFRNTNMFLMWLISQFSRQTVHERVQASLFIEQHHSPVTAVPKIKPVDEQELMVLVSKFLGDEQTLNRFRQFSELHDKKKARQTGVLSKITRTYRANISQCYGGFFRKTRT